MKKGSLFHTITEKRRFVRIPSYLPARVKVLDKSRTYRIICKNISFGGALIEGSISNRFSPHGRVILELTFPQNGSQVRAVSRVVWKDRTNRAGIEFLKISESGKGILAENLHKSLINKKNGIEKFLESINIILKSIFLTIRDLFLNWFPTWLVRLIMGKGDFAFIVHPRDIDDVRRKYMFTEFLPDKVVNVWSRIQYPLVGSKITGPEVRGSNKHIRGWMVICPLIAEIMIKNRKLACKRVVQSVRLAEKLGAKVVGLGAFTSIVTHNGKDLLNKTNAIVTTGNTYSAIAAVENLRLACSQLGKELCNLSVAIVGAGGSVGTGCADYLATKLKKLLLIEKNVGRLYELRERFGMYKHISYHTEVSRIIEADGVIVVTNTPGAVVQPYHLKNGAIVIDCAQPKNVSDRVLVERDDVVVIESAIAYMKGLDCNFDLGLEKNEVFGCLSEVIILCYGNIEKKHMIGEVNAEEMKRIKAIAEGMGIKVAKFRNFLGPSISKSLEFWN